MPWPIKKELHKNRYTFKVNCDGVVKTLTITAETKSEAENYAKKKNPGCEISYMAVHD